MRIVYLMLDSVTSSIWDSLYVKGVERTWARNLDPNHLYFRYRGNSSKTKQISSTKKTLMNNRKLNKVIWPMRESKDFMRRNRISVLHEGDVLNVNIGDRWSSISTKTLVASKFLLKNYEFDYVVRGNATTYINRNRLMEFLSELKPDYAGPIEKEKSFASGWGIVMSRLALNHIVSEFSFRNLAYFDDLAFGLTLKKRFELISLPCFKLQNIEEISTLKIEKIIESAIVRTKAFDGLGNRIDYALQQELHKLVENIYN